MARMFKLFEKISLIQVSFYLIAFYFSILFVDSAGFLANANFIVQNSFIISLAGVVLGGSIIERKYSIVNVASFVVILFLLILLSVIFWDNSFDGQTYHLQAIVEIANGWNPTKTASTDLFVTHYPKAFEKFGASIFQFTKEVETAKASNLILVTAAWLLGFTYLKSLFQEKIWPGILFATLLIINPVISIQTFSFYLDVQIASLFLILIFSFLLYLKGEKYALMIWLFSLSIIIDLKFTGLVYAALFLFFAGAYLLFFRFNRLIRFVVPNIVFAALSILVISNNPYYTNIRSGKHILYPIRGANSVDIMSGTNAPESFRYKNRFQKFFTATFSPSANIHGAKVAPEPTLKIPLTFNVKEWTVFKIASVLYGGFGPFFSAILILSFLLTLFLVAMLKKHRKEFLMLLFFLLFTVFINPECWNARYVPQLWYIPVLILVFIKLSGATSAILNYSGRAMMILAIINGSIILGINIVSNLIITTQMKNEYTWLKSSNVRVFLVKGQFKSTEQRLRKYHIDYEMIDEAERPKYTGYYEFTPISTQSAILVPATIRPYEPGRFFKKLESFIRKK